MQKDVIRIALYVAISENQRDKNVSCYEKRFIFSRQDLEAEKSDMAAPGIFHIMKKNTEITGYVRFLKYSSLKNKAALIFFI